MALGFPRFSRAGLTVEEVSGKMKDPGHGRASLPYYREHPVHAEPKDPARSQTPPAHPVTNGKETHSCPMLATGTQIGFVLESCVGEGVTIGINLSDPGDEQGEIGADTGETGERGDVTPGEVTRGLEDETENGSLPGHADQLPKEGEFPYVPPKGAHGNPVRLRGGRGFIDKDGNVWQ